ncbi:MAG: 2-keto-3-deoxy-L-rhamnonate aldolase [Ardenticatenaceae bacterium]|nr:MAG: 2-keto-3-deoxy-L-rhamnonate aldolase [Ardenticatenaceae bacterium]
MRKNTSKFKLKQGKPIYGVISSSSDPYLAELVGLVGFDYYMLDAEHGPVTPADAVNVVRACDAVDVTPMVRVGQVDMKLVLQYLDAGMMGIMMPGLTTAVSIQKFVQGSKYPPEGNRGLGPGRSANYMLGTPADQAAYVAQANDEILLLPQFEDIALLNTLPELTAVPGVDGFVIGPRDLALSMGYPDGANHSDVQRRIDDAIQIIQEAGLWVGITAGNQAAAQQQIGRGAHMILTTVSGLIQAGARQMLPINEDGEQNGQAHAAY